MTNFLSYFTKLVSILRGVSSQKRYIVWIISRSSWSQCFTMWMLLPVIFFLNMSKHVHSLLAITYCTSKEFYTLFMYYCIFVIWYQSILQPSHFTGTMTINYPTAQNPDTDIILTQPWLSLYEIQDIQTICIFRGLYCTVVTHLGPVILIG